MPAITIVDLQNAKEDVDHIAELATSASATATDRLGHTKKTWSGEMADIHAQVDSEISAVTTAMNTAVAAQVLTEKARDVALAAVNMFASTADALSKGVVGTTSLVGGTGGTNGTFDAAFSGGAGSGAAARFTVSGGAVVSIVITAAGRGYTSAPTISFAASAGLTGASATVQIANNTDSGEYFYVPSATTGEAALLYLNNAGTAQQVSRLPSSTLGLVLDDLPGPILSTDTLVQAMGRLQEQINQLNSSGLPSGALGIWYANRYDSTTNAIPNAVSTTSPSNNLFRANSRLFSNTNLWNHPGVTVTDDFDGEFSRFVGVGNWTVNITPAVSLPAGTYTIAATVKRTGAVDQSFGFSGDNTATRSPVKTATATEQRFSYTFTRAGAFNSSTALICSSDGVTGADIEVKSLDLFPGSADLGASSPDGHLYLGRNKTSTAPSVAGNVIDFTSAGPAFAQFANSSTLTNVTVLAVVSKTAAGSTHNAILSKIQDFNHLSALVDQGNVPTFYVGTNTGFDNTSGLWGYQGQGYHMLGFRYDGTFASMWLDDIMLFRTAKSVSAYALRDLYIGVINGITPAGSKINSIALYGSALTDANMRRSYTALAAHATADGLTIATARILCAEGDSITETGYPFNFGPNASPAVLGQNFAVSGSTLANLVSRASTVDAVIPPSKNGRKFILSVLIGANDLAGYSTGAAGYITDLRAYCSARAAAGWEVVVCTILPIDGNATHNSRRATVNADIVANWASYGMTAAGRVCNFAGDAIMGPDNSRSVNPTFWTDATHPNATGQARLESAVYRAVINAI